MIAKWALVIAGMALAPWFTKPVDLLIEAIAGELKYRRYKKERDRILAAKEPRKAPLPWFWALVLLAVALAACAPERPAKTPASCLASCSWGEPKGPDDTGECYCQGHAPSPQCAADEAAGLTCE